MNPQRFVDVCSARGWMAGNTPIVDWRAYLRSWEPNEKGPEKPKGVANSPPPVSPSFDAQSLQDNILTNFMAQYGDPGGDGS